MPPYGASSRPGIQGTYGAGLGAISQFGWNPDGSPSAGPYSFLPQASSYGGAGYSGWNPPAWSPGTPYGTTPSTSGSSASATGGPTASAESFLNEVMAGNRLPFGPEQRQAQLSQASDMNAAAEGARLRQMNANAAAGGASSTDPSLNSARMSSMARRQSDNTRASNDINTRANSANFGAQMNAAGMLNENSMNREAFAQGMQRTALGFLPWATGGSSSGGSTSRPQGSGFAQFGSNLATNSEDPYGDGAASYWNTPTRPRPTGGANDPSGYR